MENRDTMLAGGGPTTMWTLFDRRTVRFSLPPVRVAGLLEPLDLHVDLDADAVDETIARLVELRMKMTPPPTRN